MAFVNANSSPVVPGPDDTSLVQELPLHTLEARSGSGRYLAAVVPVTDQRSPLSATEGKVSNGR